ncbi:MaoC family dehydratase [Myxococcota bacterium]|nr:MaoC family dehydratase [Myxococcota bacterium]
MPVQTTIPSVSAIREFVGKELGVSDWIQIDQQRINDFAQATDDHQWIHCDAERAARESPFGTTVAHGYLTLALAPTLLREIVTVEGMTSALNAGCEKVRLSTPVLAGARLRMSASLANARRIPGSGMRTTLSLTFEIEGEEKPACVARVHYIYFD